MTPEEKAEQYNGHGHSGLPGLVGMRMTRIDERTGIAEAELPVVGKLMAPNGFLHAASVVALADTCCGNGTMASLPDGAVGFTTVELKSNFLGTAREGMLECVAEPAHRGRTTQVWDARVVHRDTGKKVALFRCTQMILYPR
ncbi:PaaI family thioesterase [Alloalcanivorax profundimaris]|uniref:PaaI family thioesterase n=1 Tax=Alloalcanivorax profundimaris TaxID=2735259 RepID=UPI00188820C5|nr:PaaI family thioesterase [Alloalcanivorax profundimaris]MBF1800861.1 PaaI family thioesterase [Alloalcanivorax profundimaris]